MRNPLVIALAAMCVLYVIDWVVKKFKPDADMGKVLMVTGVTMTVVPMAVIAIVCIIQSKGR